MYNIFICTYTHIYIHIHNIFNIFTHMLVYIYIYIFIYTNININMCVHITEEFTEASYIFKLGSGKGKDPGLNQNVSDPEHLSIVDDVPSSRIYRLDGFE